MLNQILCAAAAVAELTFGAPRPVVPAQMVVDLRVYTYSPMDPERTEEARLVVQRLLSAAGIESTWRLCGQRGDTCGEPAANGRIVLVHLVAVRHPAKPNISGDAMPESSALRMVRVFLPRVTELAETFRRSGSRREQPHFATLTVGHLIGLTIAHEVGHTLGLRHSRVGIMRAKLNVDDVVAARRLALAFQPRERERMLVALRPEERTVAAGPLVPGGPPVP